MNRDHLREMMFFSDHNGKREGDVISAEIELAKLILSMGKNVIVDDCNLGKKHEDMWRGFIDGQKLLTGSDIGFEIQKVETPIEECVERDSKRTRTVGRSVIYGMALQYGLYKPQKAVLCDLDGTLCDIDHRLPFVKHRGCDQYIKDDSKCACGWKKDWKAFFYNLPEDAIRMEVLDQLKQLSAEGHEIFYISARPELYRDGTEEWLGKWAKGVPYKALIMRGKNDNREDSIVKREILNKYFPDKSVITKVFDDRPRVIRMWREEGLEVVDCGTGVEF